MNEDLRQLWIDALSSGKYKKGIGYLRLKDKYCCLGVAADKFGDKEWVLGLEGAYRYGPKPFDPKYYLNSDLLDKLGLSEEDQARLASLNDDCKTFGPIILELKKTDEDNILSNLRSEGA